jgi:hypothetical protein
MTTGSPLLPYANAYLVVTAGSSRVPTLVGSRIEYLSEEPSPSSIIFRAYLKLDDSRTNYLINTPLANNGTIDSRYKGYILQYLRINSTNYPVNSMGFNNISEPLGDDIIDNGLSLRVSFSETIPGYNSSKWQNAFIEICEGKFRSNGIDRTIYESINGIPITLTVGEFSNSKMLNL